MEKDSLLLIYNNKWNIQSCVDSCGIKLMSHTKKLMKRVIDHRLGNMTRVTERLYPPDLQWMLYSCQEDYWEFIAKGRKIYTWCSDLEKAYNWVYHKRLFDGWCRRKEFILNINVIDNMYNGVIITVRTVVGDTTEFTITISLHKGSALTPTYLP